VSETSGTESTGFPPETSTPHGYTADEIAAARALLSEAGELDPAAQREQTASPDDLAAQIHAAGAEAADPDVAQMLATIQAMQSRMEKLEAQTRAQNAPDVVKYAQALNDHLAAKAAAHPVVDANPDTTFAPGLKLTGALVDAAGDAADARQPGTLERDTDQVLRWITQQARRAPHLDLGYLAELAGEVAEAAVKLAA
jgi:hypothetical protein